MNRPIRRTIMAGGLVAALALAAGVSEAHAGWWHGSHGSYGSYGSSGSWGSHGSHGSSGYVSHGSHGSRGGLFHNLRNRWHHHAGGSWGSHGGSWGSRGSWGSYGSYGSQGGWASCGSSGGGMYYQPAAPDAGGGGAMPPEPPPAGAEGGEQSTSIERDAYLTVNVPADAQVYVNSVATRSTGSKRTYVSRNLVPGYDYTYRVRAEYAVDGTIRTSEKTVQLRAGQSSNVAFDFEPPAEALTTTLKLNVPENARVTLAGNATEATGTERVYTTTRLSPGESWADYVIQVSVERDGRLVTREQSITLAGGESRELEFDFSDTKLAAAR